MRRRSATGSRSVTMPNLRARSAPRVPEGPCDAHSLSARSWALSLYAAGVRTIDWHDGAVVIIDQTALPAREVMLRLSTVDEVVDAITRLAVRGAPAIGVAGALGVALAARTLGGAELDEAVRRLAT